MEGDPLEVFLHTLLTSPRDAQVVLPGVGWLTLKTYRPYEREPRAGAPAPIKRLPFFIVDGELIRALVGLPPSGASFADERTRYLRNIRPDETEYDDEDPATVTRTPGAEIIADSIRARLCAGEAAEIPGLGVFAVAQLPSRRGADPNTGQAITIPARPIVRFEVAEALKARLALLPE